MKVLTCSETRELEERAVAMGVSMMTLMENAGSEVAGCIRSEFNITNSNIVILCGKGNNGGDGFVVAEKLCDICNKLTVILTDGEPTTPLAIDRYSRLNGTSAKVVSMEDSVDYCIDLVNSADIIVDAIYGIGFHGELKDSIKKIVEAVNKSDAKVVAVDIPSGLNGDSNNADSVHIIADTTVTFSTYKTVHLFNPAMKDCGQVVLAQVGIGKQTMREQPCSTIITDSDSVRYALPERQNDGNKGTFGRAMLVCGSYGMAGAAVLSGKAASVSGCGLVDMAVPGDIYPIVAANLIEPVYTVYGGTIGEKIIKILDSARKAKAVLIGCGLGNSSETKEIVKAVLLNVTVPVVLDADALNSIADDIDVLNMKHGEVIITPHPAEMARLCGVTVSEVENYRLYYAQKIAKSYAITVVLKGHNTITVSKSGLVAYNQTGNAGMAKGGSGDVLSGLLVSLLAQGIKPLEAAYSAVYIHGRAGDMAEELICQRGMTASSIIQELPNVLSEYE